MKSIFSNGLAAVLATLCVITAMSGFSVAVPAQPQGIDPAARKLLKASTDFLASQQRFSIDTRNSLEVVLKSGQKIELNHTARQSVQRPNKLRVERTSDQVKHVFVYDGKALTLHSPQEQFYAQVGAPGVGVADPGLNQPGVAGNVGGVARRSVRL